MKEEQWEVPPQNGSHVALHNHDVQHRQRGGGLHLGPTFKIRHASDSLTVFSSLATKMISLVDLLWLAITVTFSQNNVARVLSEYVSVCLSSCQNLRADCWRNASCQGGAAAAHIWGACAWEQPRSKCGRTLRVCSVKRRQLTVRPIRVEAAPHRHFFLWPLARDGASSAGNRSFTTWYALMASLLLCERPLTHIHVDLLNCSEKN